MYDLLSLGLVDEAVLGVPGPSAGAAGLSLPALPPSSSSAPPPNLGKPGVGKVSINNSFAPSSFSTATVKPLVLFAPMTDLADAKAGEIHPDASPREGKAADQIDLAILVECRLLRADGLSDNPREAAVELQRDGVPDGVLKPVLLPPSIAAAVFTRGAGALARLGPRTRGRGGPRRADGLAVTGPGAMIPPETLARVRWGILYTPGTPDASGAEFGVLRPGPVAVVGESPVGVSLAGEIGERSGKLNDTLRLCPFFLPSDVRVL